MKELCNYLSVYLFRQSCELNYKQTNHFHLKEPHPCLKNCRGKEDVCEIKEKFGEREMQTGKEGNVSLLSLEVFYTFLRWVFSVKPKSSL